MNPQQTGAESIPIASADEMDPLDAANARIKEQQRKVHTEMAATGVDARKQFFQEGAARIASPVVHPDVTCWAAAKRKILELIRTGSRGMLEGKSCDA